MNCPNINSVETYSRVDTDLLATHGLKHFLQLDTELLNVVEDDAGLSKKSNSYENIDLCNALYNPICGNTKYSATIRSTHDIQSQMHDYWRSSIAISEIEQLSLLKTYCKNVKQINTVKGNNVSLTRCLYPDTRLCLNIDISRRDVQDNGESLHWMCQPLLILSSTTSITDYRH